MNTRGNAEILFLGIMLLLGIIFLGLRNVLIIFGILFLFLIIFIINRLFEITSQGHPGGGRYDSENPPDDYDYSDYDYDD